MLKYNQHHPFVLPVSSGLGTRARQRGIQIIRDRLQSCPLLEAVLHVQFNWQAKPKWTKRHRIFLYRFWL